MSSRLLLAGLAKSVLAHRHAFVPTLSRTLEIGRAARLPASFDEAYGAPAPRALDAALRRGRWTQAAALCRAWARGEPARPEPLVILGVLRLWARPGARLRPGPLEALVDRYAAPEGVALLEKAVRVAPDWAPARLWLALALLRRVSLPQAWRELDALCARRPDWAWGFLVRSELGRVDIVYDKALRDLDAAERLEPGSAWVHAFRSRVLFQKAPGPEALAALDRAVALAPKAGWIKAWRADARRKTGDLSGARRDLEEALALEPYDRAWLWLGKVLRAQNDPAGAERALTRGLRACPHFEKALAERARARLELGRTEAALRDLEAAVRVNHRHNSLWNWTAELEPLTPERHRTLERLKEHAAVHPRSARAWAWLGEALTQAGLPAEGLLALDRARVLSPRRPWLSTWRGEALLRLGRLSEAEAELDRAVRRDPHDGRARAFRGRTRFLLGRPADAVSDLELASSDSMVEYSWVYHWRALAKAASGDAAGARRDAETAAQLDPSLRLSARTVGGRA